MEITLQKTMDQVNKEPPMSQTLIVSQNKLKTDARYLSEYISCDAGASSVINLSNKGS